MPAGSVIFPGDAATAAARSTRPAKAAGIYFERGVGTTPARTQLDEAPRVAILVDTSEPGRVGHVLVAAADLRPRRGLRLDRERAELAPERGDRPAGGFDVIYNAGQTTRRGDATARDRLAAFFERGGGYIATSQSAANFAFLNGAQPALIKGSLTQGSDGGGRRHRPVEQRRSERPAHGRVPGDRQPLPAVGRDLVLDAAHRRHGGRPLPAVDDGLDVRGRPLAGPRPKVGGRAVIVHGTTWRAAGTSAWPRTRSRAGTPSASGR